ncbi:hypothetical protein BESB_083810 [Besnoitia besnoiti]|uniref:CRAL-TRIO domain-containing protein n=1 Tax=Besnoitia besnoiti TaxID=94643 RepID=A0A2A9MCS8_BESBE|nr:hypothetical protein BESB_083810 [Besnoitia besnoiti]PFH33182.1 hypothetical protein BESB_083810 [Besnoitia besnoiti]
MALSGFVAEAKSVRRTEIRRTAGLGTWSVLVAALFLLLLSSGVKTEHSLSGNFLPTGLTFGNAEDLPPNYTDLWTDELFEYFRPYFKKYMKDCPIYFYRRACGKELRGNVQVMVPLGRWNLGKLTSEDRVEKFMLYLRFVLETFWRKAVRDYETEPKLVYIIDMTYVSASHLLYLWSGLLRMFQLAGPTLKNASGKSWKRSYIVNAPYLLSSLLDLLGTFVPFRRHDVVVLSSTDGDDAKLMRKELGDKCLWRGFGGNSSVAVDGADTQTAIVRFIAGGDRAAAGQDAQMGNAEGTVNANTPDPSQQGNKHASANSTQEGEGSPMGQGKRRSTWRTRTIFDAVRVKAVRNDSAGVEVFGADEKQS